MTKEQQKEFFDLYETSEREALKYLRKQRLVPDELNDLYKKVLRYNSIYEREGFVSEDDFDAYLEAKIDLFTALGIEDPVLRENTHQEAKIVLKEALSEDVNIYSLFTYWSVPIDDVAKEYQDEYRENYEDEIAEYDHVVVTEDMIEDFSYADFMSFERDEFLYYVTDELLPGDYYGYLAFMYRANWRGSSAYTLTEDIERAVFFDHDASLYYQSKGPGYVKLTYASHDLPMGSDYYIIGLDRDTYETLEELDFNEVKDFVSTLDLFPEE
jgi:hypothetical protein